MRKIICLILVFLCAGCVSVKVSRYIKEESPYKKNFYASFEETLLAVNKALEEFGWKVTETADPQTYERDQGLPGESVRQVLLFTEVRQTPLIVSSRYMNLNVFLRWDGQKTGVEIRYQAVTPVLVKDMRSQKNDAVVNKILDRIGELLKKK